MSLRVRERPPLALDVGIKAPSGRRTRWAGDDPDGGRVPAQLRFSSTMPGGHETCGCVLARDPSISYPDLAEESKVTVRGLGGGMTMWQGRLETAPSVSGDQMSISPGCVGYQSLLDDRSDLQPIYVDSDLSAWQAAAIGWQKANMVAGYVQAAGQVAPDAALLPALQLAFDTDSAGGKWAATMMYDAGPGNKIVGFYVDWQSGTNVPPIDRIYSSDVDDKTATTTEAGNSGTGIVIPGAGYHALATPSRFLFAEIRNDASTLTEGLTYAAFLASLAVFATGVTRQGTAPGGVLCSDVEAHAIGTWAPGLAFTTGSYGSIAPSSYVINHLSFRRQPTSVSGIVRAAARFELRDWAVWDGPVYYSNDRGARGRKWRARVRPSGLQSAGPQLQNLWDSVVVFFQDVDGTTRLAGPVGSGCDIEDASLYDATIGVGRRKTLTIGTSTPGGAVTAGVRFLGYQKLTDTSGSAELVGYVEDDRGVLWPSSVVRAGDQIAFTDAADPGYRRIVRAEYTDADKACRIDLDQPPEALQALLERYGDAISPLGVA